jgi:hypothetical protein
MMAWIESRGPFKPLTVLSQERDGGEEIFAPGLVITLGK